MQTIASSFLTFLLVAASMTYAGEADVVGVEVRKRGSNLYDISVAVRHQDTGWEHYANRWEVVDEKGTLLGTRTLHHPHVDEQPFTRVLSGLVIPAGVKTVTIRSHDSVHQYGGKSVTIDLPLQ
ncbi:MAG: hypothetical protein ABW092_10995 [Candidatus Thiodiazotropha sp.]